MNAQVYAHPEILSQEHWVGYVRREQNGELKLYPSSERVGETLHPTSLNSLMQRDETLAQLAQLPPLTQAWRWEPDAEFTRHRLPVGPTYYFSCEAKPGPEHPEKARVGFVVVNGWIRTSSAADAQAIFDQEVQKLHLIVEHREEPEIHRAQDYQDAPEGREYFEQAQLDGEVIVCHIAPKYPVYWLTILTEQGSPPQDVEVHYFLCADAICEEDEDVFDPEFWTGERTQVALEATRNAIEELGWTMKSVLDQRPCGGDDVPEELLFAYDEAEESGACLVCLSEEDQEDTSSPS